MYNDLLDFAVALGNSRDFKITYKRRDENEMTRDLDIAKTALLIVDMQNDFVRCGGAMQVEDALKTVPAIKSLLDFARAKDMPVIYTKFVTGKNSSLLWNWSPQIEQDNACRRCFERHYPDIQKTLNCSDIIDELSPLQNEYVIEKYWYSSFRNTSLVDVLQSENCDTVIVTGTVTQICVEDTVHDAFANGFKVIVAQDGVSSFDDELHQATLKNIEMKYGYVMTSEEIIKNLKR